MRITPQQAQTIRMFTHRYFGEDAEIWLFGSRADDKKRGGDYDFLIETSLNQPDIIIEHKITMIAELQSTSTFEEEKIDLIVKRRNSSFDMPIYGIAKKRRGKVMTPEQLMLNCQLSIFKYLMDLVAPKIFQHDF